MSSSVWLGGECRLSGEGGLGRRLRLRRHRRLLPHRSADSIREFGRRRLRTIRWYDATSRAIPACWAKVDFVLKTKIKVNSELTSRLMESGIVRIRIRIYVNRYATGVFARRPTLARKNASPDVLFLLRDGSSTFSHTNWNTTSISGF